MSSSFEPENLPQSTPHNQPEFTVTELSGALKRTVEDAFSYVRVRGEISGCKLAPSGHLYFSLKDENALLAAICWRGVVQKLPFKPQDGLEVVCTGHITTYAGQSKYQLIVESMQPAGEGALMALLLKRKQQLQAEGLFDASRKKKLPFFPRVIGVVTSPTGAVIRDILHRLEDRFPCHVLVWPVLVQGEQAAVQIAGAIDGFNALVAGGGVPRPDVIIVARGGGSLEDLWAFNEEIVVRSAANSAIPLISAVGHETDTTLIDYASDLRAPTPTAAAELATPVLQELRLALKDADRRMMHGASRLLEEKRNHIEGLRRGLPNPAQMLEQAVQRVDELMMRLPQMVARMVEFKEKHMREIAASIPHPRYVVDGYMERLRFTQLKLFHALEPAIKENTHRLALLASRLTARPLMKEMAILQERLQSMASLLESFHYKKVLERGFALVRDSHDRPVTSIVAISKGESLVLELKDGKQTVIAAGGGAPVKKTLPVKKDAGQGALF